MKVEALDHINIITDRLDKTATFYEDLLDLGRRDPPPPLTPQNAQWMYDASDRAIIHINTLESPRAYDRDVPQGGLTGAVHHVALRLQGFEEVQARLDARGADYKLNLVEAIGLRQIFTADPNNVLLELNFFAD